MVSNRICRQLTLFGSFLAVLTLSLSAGSPSAGQGDAFTNPKDGLTYVRIPAGSFRMGCVPGWAGGYKPAVKECNSEETPRHIVTITEPFYLSQTEVTVGAFKRFCEATGRTMPDGPHFDPKWECDSCPMVRVTWEEANAYCAWVGGRLPTEAEWEHAARAGTSDQYYWGGSFDPKHAWCRENVPGGRKTGGTQPVAALKPNSWGLYDAVGNVWEWCLDWYDPAYYGKGPAKDPKGPDSGEFRVQRGGSWYDIPWVMRLSARGRTKMGNRLDNTGFRCLLPEDVRACGHIPEPIEEAHPASSGRPSAAGVVLATCR